MHKSFYASGFIYHPPTKQILLQQLLIDNKEKLVLFRGISRNGYDPQTVFKQTIDNALKENFSLRSIRPIYDYIHEKLGEHFIFYVEIGGIKPKIYSAKKTAWLSLAKLSKFEMSEQTRHDIIVGERVIRSLNEIANPTPKLHH